MNNKLLLTVGCVAALTGCTNVMPDPGGGTGGDGDDMVGDDVVGTTEPLDLGSNPFLVPLDAIPLDDVEIRDNILSRRAIFIGNDLAADVMSEVMTQRLAGIGTEDVTMLTRGLRPEVTAGAAVATAAGVRTYTIADVPDPSVSGDLPSGPACSYAQSPTAQALAARSCSMLVADALDRAETESIQRLNASPLEDIDAMFSESLNANMWYANAANFGLGNLLAPMAVQLRGAALCDQVVTPATSAFERGVDIGQVALRAEADTIRPRFPTSIPWNADRNLCNPETQIVFPARSNVMGRIDSLVNANPLCEGFNSTNSEETSRYARSMQELRSGIAEGVLRAASRLTDEYMTGPSRLTCLQEPPPAPPPAPPTPPSFGTGSAGTPPWASLPSAASFPTPGGPSAADIAAAQFAEAQRIAEAAAAARAIANAVRAASFFGSLLGGLFEPLTLDLNGDGVHMESVENGPVFDFGNGPVRTAWTTMGDALLCMDRDGDGEIVATELFGDVTVTEDGAQAPEGWAALALYDMASRGGNGDGVIDENDEAYASLSLWLDNNGDAHVQPGELQSLSAHGVINIDLNWQRFTRADGTNGEAVDLWFPFEQL